MTGISFFWGGIGERSKVRRVLEKGRRVRSHHVEISTAERTGEARAKTTGSKKEGEKLNPG